MVSRYVGVSHIWVVTLSVSGGGGGLETLVAVHCDRDGSLACLGLCEPPDRPHRLVCQHLSDLLPAHFGNTQAARTQTHMQMKESRL